MSNSNGKRVGKQRLSPAVVCWSCNSSDMECKGDYWECPRCGATWVKPRKLVAGAKRPGVCPYESAGIRQVGIRRVARGKRGS